MHCIWFEYILSKIKFVFFPRHYSEGDTLSLGLCLTLQVDINTKGKAEEHRTTNRKYSDPEIFFRFSIFPITLHAHNPHSPQLSRVLYCYDSPTPKLLRLSLIICFINHRPRFHQHVLLCGFLVPWQLSLRCSSVSVSLGRFRFVTALLLFLIIFFILTFILFLFLLLVFGFFFFVKWIAMFPISKWKTTAQFPLLQPYLVLKNQSRKPFLSISILLFFFLIEILRFWIPTIWNW